MNKDALIMLYALYYSTQEVSTIEDKGHYNMTCITDAINTLRNDFSIQISVEGVYCDPFDCQMHYSKYTLVQSKKNLKKVKKILITHSTKKPLKKADS